MRRSAGQDFRDRHDKLQRHASISTSVAATASALISMRKQHKSAKRKFAYQNNLVHQICFVLFVMTSPSASLALAYAEHARRQGKWVENISAESLQEKYLQTSIEEIANIMDGEQVEPRVLRAAKQFQKEHKLHQWIQIQNIQKGLAPSSARIVQEANRLEQNNEQEDDLLRSRGGDLARTKWMQRFKKRWRLKKGTFHAGERIPQEEAQAKVGAYEKGAAPLIFGNLRTRRGPNSGTIWRSQNRDRNKTFVEK